MKNILLLIATIGLLNNSVSAAKEIDNLDIVANEVDLYAMVAFCIAAKKKIELEAYLIQAQSTLHHQALAFLEKLTNLDDSITLTAIDHSLHDRINLNEQAALERINKKKEHMANLCGMFLYLHSSKLDAIKESFKAKDSTR